MDKLMNDTIFEIRNKSSRFILSPTNIFSIDNPNELLMVDDKLVGVFIPSKSEEKAPALFLRRILNSKLVYSNILRVALIIEEQNPLLEYRDIINSADILIHPGEYDRFTKRLNHPAERTITFPVKIKQRSIRRFNKNFAFYEFSKDKQRDFNPIILKERTNVKYGDSILKSQQIMSEKVWVEEKPYTLYVKNSDKAIISVARSLQSFLTYTFYLHYQIDDFQIHESYLFGNGYAFYNTQDINNDLDVIQKLCFAGFIPSELGSLDECEDLIKGFHNYGKKR